MRFQTPQFIDVEDRIFGPLTFRQFVYLVGGAGFSIIFWVLLPIYIAVFFIGPVVALSLALAFFKINNKPFIFTLEAAFHYARGHRLYIWKKTPKAQKSIQA
jgi:hypothetical protein